MIKRELLLVLKTNNYLRAIDRRLGNPTNTFNIINEKTWNVYWNEVSKEESYYSLLREFFRFYILKIGLFAMYLRVKFRSSFGMQVDVDELKDFELDYQENNVDKLSNMQGSKTFEELEAEKSSSAKSTDEEESFSMVSLTSTAAKVA